MLVPMFHAFIVVLNIYTIWYDQRYLDMPFPANGYAEMLFKARFMFFTMWCLILQTVYFSISLVDDILGPNDPGKRSLIRKIRDVTFSVAFPTAVYVAISFWAIYAYNKDLIFPDYVEAIVPFWMNVVIHIFVAVFVIAELLVRRITYPSRKLGLGLSIGFNLSYLIWLHFLHATTGVWPYPILERINLPTRIVFSIMSFVSGYGYYVLGEKLSKIQVISVNSEYRKKLKL